MKQLSQIYVRLEEMFTRLLILSIVGLVFMEVVMRFFNSPTTWSVGVSQLLFIWLIFFGANQALRNNGHVGVDVITILLPIKVQKYIQIFVKVLMIVFFIVIIVYGAQMTLSGTGRLITGTTLGYHYVTLAIPIGGTLMLITSLIQLLKACKEMFLKKSFE